jgi:hypothetical protein
MEEATMKVDTPRVDRLTVRRPAWETPRIAVVGRIRDVVQGFGKSGPNDDADPQNTAKTGMG